MPISYHNIDPGKVSRSLVFAKLELKEDDDVGDEDAGDGEAAGVDLINRFRPYFTNKTESVSNISLHKNMTFMAVLWHLIF
jgi:hypothetical protein